MLGTHGVLGVHQPGQHIGTGKVDGLALALVAKSARTHFVVCIIPISIYIYMYLFLCLFLG